MKYTFCTKASAGFTAATFCLVLMPSNQSAAQVTLPRGEITQGHYSPYSQSFDTGYRTDNRGTRTDRFREFSGYRGTGGYNGYEQGPYGYKQQGTYVYPSATYFRQGTYYRGGYSPQFRTFGSSRHSNASRHHIPYRYGRN